MAGTGANTVAIEGILKDYIEDFVAEQVNNMCPLKDEFKTESLPFGGSEVVYTSHVGRNPSPMFVGEDSAFADAGNQKHVKIRIDQRKMMARYRLTWEAIHDSGSSKGAWKSARKDEAAGLINDAARREEFALCTDGRGILALVDEATPTGNTTLELDAPGGITNDNFGNRFIWPGMTVGFVNPATGALRGAGKKVTACNDDGTDVTLEAAPGSGTADNDYVVQLANGTTTDVADSSYEHAWWGVVALCDDGTYRNNYFGADRSQLSAYKSYVKSSTGAQSADLYQQISDILAQKLGAKVSQIWMHHSTRRVFIQLAEQDRRYSGNSLKNPDPGTKAFEQDDLTFGNVTIKALRDFPLDMVMFVDVKGVGGVRYVSSEGQFEQSDGNILVRDGTGSSARHAFEAWWYKRQQFHWRFPGKAARLDGVTGQSLIVVRAE